VVTNTGGAEEDEKIWIKKANAAFIQLCWILKARKIAIATKLTVFRSNVKSVLLYGCQTWKVAQWITRDLQTLTNSFITPIRCTVNTTWKLTNRCLRKTFKIF
jgi:hypothetical protein